MSALDITLAPEEAAVLKRHARSVGPPQREGCRARIILIAVLGEIPENFAHLTGFYAPRITGWWKRFHALRLDGLIDRLGRGRKLSLPVETVRRVLEHVIQPRIGVPRWSWRSASGGTGIFSSAVHKLWGANDLRPHLSRTFKLSSDPLLEEKFWDAIGFYLVPPDKAFVLCFNKQSQVQTLERTPPGMPLGIDHIQTKPHDYTRYGTLTLFAALDSMQGRLICSIERQHRHQEWLAKHLRFRIHCTPTSSSWVDLVGRVFRGFSMYLRDGTFCTLRRLESSITTFVALRNTQPVRYVWSV